MKLHYGKSLKFLVGACLQVVWRYSGQVKLATFTRFKIFWWSFALFFMRYRWFERSFKLRTTRRLKCLRSLVSQATVNICLIEFAIREFLCCCSSKCQCFFRASFNFLTSSALVIRGDFWVNKFDESTFSSMLQDAWNSLALVILKISLTFFVLMPPPGIIFIESLRTRILLD